MRAINLVPADSRQGKFNAGKSGGAAFALIGALAVVLIALVVLSMAKSQKATAEQELATVNQNTQAFSAAASQYTSFEQAAQQATQRIDTVKSLASARFDWAGSLRDLARLIPVGTRIDTLSASVSVASASGGGQFRGAIPTPAITLTGCTPSQNTAANMVTQLQAMRRVTNVTLEFTKLSATHGSGVNDGSCQDYTFAIDVFFAQGTAQPSASAVPATAAAASTETVSNTATTNAAATTPGATTPATTPTSGN